MNNNDSFWLRIIYVISIVISGAVAFLILGPRPEGIEGSLDVSSLPLVNASLNLVTTVLLILGLFLILNKERALHKNVMLTSFGTSAAFLVSYIIYHWFKSGPKKIYWRIPRNIFLHFNNSYYSCCYYYTLGFDNPL